MPIFTGHRRRMAERFRSEGLDRFDEPHVLELLLFYCIPQADTFLLAHALLERFGSLSKVLEAPAEELERVPGVDAQTSTLLRLIPAIARYDMIRRSASFTPLTTVDACAAYLTPFFRGRRNESVYLLCLDAKREAICCREVGQGAGNSAIVSIRGIVELALCVNAVTVVLAHNHPGGVPFPSPDDIVTTRRLAKALDCVDIVLADHILFADEEYISMARSRYYDPADRSQRF